MGMPTNRPYPTSTTFLPCTSMPYEERSACTAPTVGGRTVEMIDGETLSPLKIGKENPKAKIVGLDSSEGMLRELKNKLPNIKIITGSFNNPENLKLKENYFDLVISTGALSEYGSKKAFSLAYSVLKNDGALVNVGIKKNIIGWIIGALANFKPRGVKKILKKLTHITKGKASLKMMLLPFSYPIV